MRISGNMTFPNSLRSQFEPIEQLPGGKAIDCYRVRDIRREWNESVVRFLPERFSADREIVNLFHSFFSQFSAIPNRTFLHRQRAASAQRQFGARLHADVQEARDHRADAAAGERQHDAQNLELLLVEGFSSERQPEHGGQSDAAEHKRQDHLELARRLRLVELGGHVAIHSAIRIIRPRFGQVQLV